MNLEYPRIGSKWKDRDLRVKRTVDVIRYDLVTRRVRTWSHLGHADTNARVYLAQTRANFAI